MPLKPILPPLIAALSPSQRLANQRTGTEFGEPRSLLRQHKAESAWVLLFNPGERNEGVYTLQGRETPEAPHGTYVLAFEEQEEASRFAMLLQVRRAPLAALSPRCLDPTRAQPTRDARRKASTWRRRRSGRRSCWATSATRPTSTSVSCRMLRS